MTHIVVERENLNTNTHKLCGNEGRDLTSQGMLRIASRPPEPGEKHEIAFSLTARRRNQHC